MRARSDTVITEGVAEEALRGGQFRVRVQDRHVVLARLSGKMRQHRIRIIPGDRVQVELSAYDLSRGRITYRFK